MNGPRTYSLTATSVVGNPSQTGNTTVTVNLRDPDGNTTSTSFVLKVVSSTDAAPSFSASSDPLYLVCPVPTPNPTPPLYHYVVASNDSTTADDLRVTATSSNTNLVPNDSLHLVASSPAPTGDGTVTITPNLPLPAPGAPQSSTITLSVTDGAYTQQSSFLYIVSDATSPASLFGRPTGIYSLDPNSFQHRSKDKFLTGETQGVTWNELESAPVNGVDQFHFADVFPALFTALPVGQDLSLNLQEEPCYIAQNATMTWCDVNNNNSGQLTDCGTITYCTLGVDVKRAVPWDPYLRARRDNFLNKLAGYLNDNGYMGRVSIINPNLPGAETGIRKASISFDSMMGYSREALLGAVQDELRTVQDNFPGKLVQIGFFTSAKDNQDASFGNKTLWQWLYRDASSFSGVNSGVPLISLYDEFNGVKRPRVSFFQENLAAARTPTPPSSASSAPNYLTPPMMAAYTLTPDPSLTPSFAYYPSASIDSYKNGITFQATTPWSNPFVQFGGDGAKLTKTINGSPNDGLEGAFNTYHSECLEVYPGDLDQAQPQGTTLPTLNAVLCQGELQSWKNYTDSLRTAAPIEPPAGLTVARASSTSNLVSWSAVYGVTAYKLQRSTTGPTGGWTDVPCSDTSLTYCTDIQATGSAYYYQVQPSAPHPTASWSHVAVLLSEGIYGGYVTSNGSGFQASPTGPQPGIRAGRGTTNVQLKGFLSFDTSSLTGTTILGAKLRLKETSDTAGSTLGTCFVDIAKGTFGNVGLEGTDFVAMATDAKVMRIPPLDAGLTLPNWVVGDLGVLYPSDINNTSLGHTQFRLYFNGTTNNKQVQWNSGESPGNEPQLILQY